MRRASGWPGHWPHTSHGADLARHSRLRDEHLAGPTAPSGPFASYRAKLEAHCALDTLAPLGRRRRSTSEPHVPEGTEGEGGRRAVVNHCVGQLTKVVRQGRIGASGYRRSTATASPPP